MPSILEFQWRHIEKAYKADEYAMILWKIYTGKDSKVGGIPYLSSRRTMFYKFGSVKNIDKLWLDNGLVELDPRFKEVVKEWNKFVV